MIYVVGIGPGNEKMMTLEAVEAIKKSDVIVGYRTYINLVKDLIADKEIVENGMRQEVARCERAIEIAKTGKTVSVISSGDPGVYAMAGLILELAQKESSDIEVEIISGVTSSLAAAAILGAPLMHDFCHISLSDLMTPWDVIEKRIDLASQADFVICLYNPRSRTRVKHLPRAVELMLKSKSEDTPVGIVKDAGRENQETIITTLGKIDYEKVDMTTVVIIGNKSTYIKDNRIITPRGYNI